MRLLISATVLATSLLTSIPVRASPLTLHFPPYTNGTTVSGTVQGTEMNRYFLSLKTGQRIIAHIHSSNTRVFVLLRDPNGDVLSDSSQNHMPNNLAVSLAPMDGLYSLEVFLYHATSQQPAPYTLGVTAR
ncbi:hypothetical protein [Gluconobacter morbifer]|uniref:Peptidase C-terminal archaeal/bacterial domain-containing protein n=1 Tax=Gluconobacter morbifer G707 TaxID=1088869 RepID=G6XKG3_9PROT|nr:hypothetical protein [Gluconobacter morbifer]EHH67759.1 hypothetical protein GMO_19790 [Gluconobacter morbifer G707]